ncbi:hypothetical protein P3T76_010624 [Phytophthora citrophthora]|uniref:RxLR effector PexRD54 WY domain-containing protein n=1 Tax=Phytophthora citrophthora TaxID=4793 RepID=A0AAD9GBM1_9STRA|nr:hypothetical protein P3T76_010624 [Phytophthora citrophthora]
MRPFFLVLFGVAVLLQSTNAASLVKTSHITRNVHFHSEAKLSIVRRLRFTPEEEEERGFVVSKLQNFVNNQQLARWLKNGKSTDDVFTKLKLNKAGSTIFENPKFVAWIKYVDDFNSKHNKGEAISAIPTLSKQYGDDVLATMLQKARQVETTKATATRLQTEQMKIWRSEGISSDAVFATFKLDEGVANLLMNPGFNIWARYLTEFNPGKKTTIFKTLEAHFSENTLSQLLIAAQKNPSTEKLATSLQNVQLQGFLERGETPNAVFKLLQLDKGADNLFANPLFTTWRKYATDFQKTKSDGAVPVIDTLTAHYTDISLVKMITTAKATEGTKNMATYVEKSLVGKWAKDGKEPEYVSKLLWTSATDKKNLEAAYLEQLLIQSTVKVSSKFQLEQISVWMGKKETPDAVFKLMGLNKGTENVFKRPQFDTWLKFALTSKKQNPEASKSVFSTLSAHYDDLPLAKMIKTAKEDANTKKIAEHVERGLLVKWAGDGKAPAYVLNKLATDKQDKERVLSLFMKEIRKVEDKITRAES